MRMAHGESAGKGSRERCGVIMQDSRCKGCVGRVVVDVRCRVRMMARDVASRIRGYIPQDGIVITSGDEELCWGRIGTLI